MSGWQDIAAVTDINLHDVLLWNGKRVFLGWRDDDGWHDSTNRDHMDRAEDPQPTHWMPLPNPPTA